VRRYAPPFQPAATNGDITEIQLVGRSIEDGALAFISIRVDTSASHTETFLGGGGFGPSGTDWTIPASNGTTLPVYVEGRGRQGGF